MLLNETKEKIHAFIVRRPAVLWEFIMYIFIGLGRSGGKPCYLHCNAVIAAADCQIVDCKLYSSLHKAASHKLRLPHKLGSMNAIYLGALHVGLLRPAGS